MTEIAKSIQKVAQDKVSDTTGSMVDTALPDLAALAKVLDPATPLAESTRILLRLYGFIVVTHLVHQLTASVIGEEKPEPKPKAKGKPEPEEADEEDDDEDDYDEEEDDEEDEEGEEPEPPKRTRRRTPHTRSR